MGGHYLKSPVTCLIRLQRSCLLQVSQEEVKGNSAASLSIHVYPQCGITKCMSSRKLQVYLYTGMLRMQSAFGRHLFGWRPRLVSIWMGKTQDILEIRISTRQPHLTVPAITGRGLGASAIVLGRLPTDTIFVFSPCKSFQVPGKSLVC